MFEESLKRAHSAIQVKRSNALNDLAKAFFQAKLESNALSPADAFDLDKFDAFDNEFIKTNEVELRRLKFYYFTGDRQNPIKYEGFPITLYVNLMRTHFSDHHEYRKAERKYAYEQLAKGEIEFPEAKERATESLYFEFEHYLKDNNIEMVKSLLEESKLYYLNPMFIQSLREEAEEHFNTTI